MARAWRRQKWLAALPPQRAGLSHDAPRHAGNVPHSRTSILGSAKAFSRARRRAPVVNRFYALHYRNRTRLDGSRSAASAAIAIRMKTYQICAVAFAAVLVVSCTRTPKSAATAEPRTFLKIGNTYRITTVPAGDAAGLPGNVVKVREHVGGGWCRVECFV